MAFRFTKTPKPQRFNYKTRFLDPEKEELKERLKRIEQQKTGERDTEAVKSRIQSNFKRKSGRATTDRSFRSAQVRRSNMTLLLVVIVLCLGAYYLLNQNLAGLLEWLN